MDKPLFRDDEFGRGQRPVADEAGDGFLDDLSRAEEVLLGLGGHLFGTRYHTLSFTDLLGSGHDLEAPRVDPLPVVENGHVAVEEPRAAAEALQRRLHDRWTSGSQKVTPPGCDPQGALPSVEQPGQLPDIASRSTEGGDHA